MQFFSEYGIIMAAGVLTGLVVLVFAMRRIAVHSIVASGTRVAGRTEYVRKSRIPGFGYVQVGYTVKGRPRSAVSGLMRLKRAYAKQGVVTQWYVGRARTRAGMRFVAVKYDG